MGACSSSPGSPETPTKKQEKSPASNAVHSATKKSGISSKNGGRKRVEMSPEMAAVPLEQVLHRAASLLEGFQDESQLSKSEITEALNTYKELQRILSVATRTGDWMSKPVIKQQNTLDETTKETGILFHERFQKLQEEIQSAETVQQDMLAAHPAMVRPLTLETVDREIPRNIFFLDNSLRETTVGASQGHSLEEKYAILKSMAETGMQEVILGSFGTKISVDSQISARWKDLGRTFDSAWGFCDIYDWESYDERPLWDDMPKFLEHVKHNSNEAYPFVTPPANIRFDYDKDDLDLLTRASQGFRPNAFGGKSLQKVLEESSSKIHGRIPLGLIMMAGYGICNAIMEVDTTLETFDYQKYDVMARCQFLIKWCHNNLPSRNVSGSDHDKAPRVLVNLRDFTNFQRSPVGRERALHLVDTLSRHTPNRPFGFMMEEPSGWLLPDEVAKLCRMVRLTMQRAGHPHGKFLVHIHMAFGMADMTQLLSLANGADGVWAALTRTGAQVGHACSTVTAVNLFRLGHQQVAKQVNLRKMVQAARRITEITTRKPCGTHEEVYGELAFDIPYVMTNLPACRYTLALVVQELDIQRTVRLNELSSVYAVQMAMQERFGKPVTNSKKSRYGSGQASSWDPQYCPQMREAIHNHLLTGLSRDYNTKIGLGHLYRLVSRKALPLNMVAGMMVDSSVPDCHPTILDFTYRWNRLCTKYLEKELPPCPEEASRSTMLYNHEFTNAPILNCLPFDYYMADVVSNEGPGQFPKLLRLHMVRRLAKDEARHQNTKFPLIHFYETIVRLKLFIQEATHKGFLPLVDDFAMQRPLEALFGDELRWLHEQRSWSDKTVFRQTVRALIKQIQQKARTRKAKSGSQNTSKAAERMLAYVERRFADHQALPEKLSKELSNSNLIPFGPGVLEVDVDGDDDLVDTSCPSNFNQPHRQVIQQLTQQSKEEDYSESRELEEIYNATLGIAGPVNDLDSAYFGEPSNEAASALIQKFDEVDIWQTSLHTSSFEHPHLLKPQALPKPIAPGGQLARRHSPFGSFDFAHNPNAMTPQPKALLLVIVMRLLCLSLVTRRAMSFAPRHLGLAAPTGVSVVVQQQQPWMRQPLRLFAASASPPAIKHIGKAHMEELLEDYEAGDSEFVVIDVRTSEEILNTGKLSPSVHTLPVQIIMEKNVFALDEEDFEDLTGFEKPAPDATLVFSCAAGIRSVYACQFASQAGYSKLINYTGGSNEWFQPSSW
ncbi:expressed unknown protein [Seminavis robusta]|uniref:Rhodanese domain-containing protein n=1 Tax=Seminavis robusta TaxID=568900 RepID=A0A9N8HGV2_9STRA|nr:expressed unknown protein [Seminavis robusta]|eukprot:Sro599_g173120.1 n/a (1234) ;mRNA; f:533-4530